MAPAHSLPACRKQMPASSPSQKGPAKATSDREGVPELSKSLLDRGPHRRGTSKEQRLNRRCCRHSEPPSAPKLARPWDHSRPPELRVPRARKKSAVRRSRRRIQLLPKTDPQMKPAPGYTDREPAEVC